MQHARTIDEEVMTYHWVWSDRHFRHIIDLARYIFLIVQACCINVAFMLLMMNFKAQLKNALSVT